MRIDAFITLQAEPKHESMLLCAESICTAAVAVKVHSVQEGKKNVIGYWHDALKACRSSCLRVMISKTKKKRLLYFWCKQEEKKKTSDCVVRAMRASIFFVLFFYAEKSKSWSMVVPVAASCGGSWTRWCSACTWAASPNAREQSRW